MADNDKKLSENSWKEEYEKISLSPLWKGIAEKIESKLGDPLWKTSSKDVSEKIAGFIDNVRNPDLDKSKLLELWKRWVGNNFWKNKTPSKKRGVPESTSFKNPIKQSLNFNFKNNKVKKPPVQNKRVQSKIQAQGQNPNQTNNKKGIASGQASWSLHWDGKKSWGLIYWLSSWFLTMFFGTSMLSISWEGDTKNVKLVAGESEEVISVNKAPAWEDMKNAAGAYNGINN